MEANLAVLIDFENIAAGTEKEGLGRFDVDALMKRLKDKGRILVSRSYADWGRFARFKQTLLAANVTMMELTSHGMQDKNRADIAMVVDCLELAFTKDYIDTFVVVSGDSDFTPLVLKMRELNKRVIGCGTRASTSRLLVQACDEFMFYDTIVRESRQAAAQPKPRRGAAEGREAVFELLVDTLEGMQRENPDPVLASIVKTALLRKSPDFNEVDLGFGTFARFLEEAQEAGYVRISRDRKSGGYRVDSADSTAPADDEEHESEADERPSRRSRGGAPADNGEGWTDPYLPQGADAIVGSLDADGVGPLAFSTRMAILQMLEQIVDERKKKRRRVTVQFVQDDVKKRLKKNHPDVPLRAVKGVFNALMRAGLLLHKDGRPVRSATAPFAVDKSAEEMNDKLVDFWLDVLRGKGGVSDVGLAAEVFFGDKERRRKVEETLAWLAARPETDEDLLEEGELPPEPEIDLDDVLLTEEPSALLTEDFSPDEVDLLPEPTEAAVEEPPAEPEAQPQAEQEAPADEEAPRKRRRRTRTRKKKDETASTDTDLDLDAVLDVSED